ncbi:MAG TPA: transcriptional repressor LexA [Anaerolineae bacterium]|nr:transcriptional repressor LexA [Anaerolineae bacterium]
MAKKKGLSERQESILEYIWQAIQDSGRPPTIREIGHAVKISSTSVVNYNLTKLVEKGFLLRESDVSRGLRLTDKALALYGQLTEAVENVIRLPLVGSIAAGEPIDFVNDGSFESYDDDDALELSASLLPGRTDNLYALRVSGTSMIDAMVDDGDIVVMRKQSEARNGDMVAAWLTGSDTTTLKYFFNEGERVRLQPANPTMDPIFVNPRELRVQGKVMMVVRQMM